MCFLKDYTSFTAMQQEGEKKLQSQIEHLLLGAI